MRMLALTVSLLALALSGCDAVLPHSSQNASKQQGADANPMRPPVQGSARGGPGSISATTATFSPDGKLLLIRYVWQKGFALGATKPPDHFAQVRIWDVEKGTEWPAASDALATELDRAVFLFLPDGKALLVGSNERPMRLCEFPSGKVLLTFPDDSIGAFPRDVSPDGKLALAIQPLGRGLELWDVTQGKVVRALSRSAVSSACFSPDGKRVFAPDNVPDRTNAVAVWDTASGELRLMLAAADGWRYPLAFSPDDHFAVSESSLSLEPGEKSTLALWDWTTGQGRRVFEKREGGREGVTTEAQAAAFSPDGKAIVTLDYDQMLRRWSVATGKAILQVSLQQEHPSVYALTKDGRLALTAGGSDGGPLKRTRVKLWDTTTGKVARTLIRSGDEP